MTMDERRRRLLYRATHRGTLEADRLVGGFAQAHLDGLAAAELDAFETLIEERDDDLVDWLMGRREAPAPVDGPLLRRMMAFKNDG
jgi:antitoxin CptB